MRRFAAILALALVANLAVTGQFPAAACSCAYADPVELAGSADVGFIGRLHAVTGEQDAVWDFDVEHWIDGELTGATVQIDAPRSGASCGFEVGRGELVAVFAWREPSGSLTGGLCSTLDPEITMNALTSGPAPGGLATIAVAGGFAEGVFALLDESGTIVGHRGSPQRWVPQVHPCPGGHHVVVLGYPMIEVFDLATFDVVRAVDTEDLQQRASILDLSCQTPDGSAVQLLVESSDARSVEIRSLADHKQPGPSVERPAGAQLWLAAERIVSIEPQDPGAHLVVTDPDGERRVIGVMERTSDSTFAGYETALVSPGADEVIASEVTYRSGEPSGRLVRIDLASGSELAELTLGASAFLRGWTPDGRLILLTTGADGDGIAALQIHDPTTLEMTASIPGWNAWSAFVADDDVWGSQNGSLIRGSLDATSFDVVASMTTQATGDVVRLPAPLQVQAADGVEPSVSIRRAAPITQAELELRAARSEGGSRAPSTGLIGLGAVVLAAAAMLLWRRRQPASVPGTGSGPT